MTIWQAWTKRLGAALFVGIVAAQAALAAPVLTIDAAPNPAHYGDPLTVDIKITGAVDLYAFQFDLSFDPALLQVVGVAEGAFVPSGGGTSFFGGTIDQTLGSISFIADSLNGPGSGVNGDGVLASISFSVSGTGLTPLGLSNLVFLDSNFADLPGLVAQNRDLRVVPEPASLALVGISLLGLAAMRGRQTV